MEKRFWNKLILMLAKATLIVLIASAVHGQSHQLIVGVVPQFEARQLYNIWKPILDTLSREIGKPFVLQGAPNIAAFEKAFMKGEYDLAYMNPYHYILAEQHQGYIPLVRDVKNQLFGVLVVAEGIGITHVNQLAGKTIAFPSPNALGAALQMRQELHDIFHLDYTAKYVKTHDSVYLNVLLGQTAAGGGVQKTLNRQSEDYRRRLTIIHTTEPVAPHPIVVHPRVAPEMRRHIQSTLIEIENNPRGRAMFAKVPIKEIGIASPGDYLKLKGMKLERFYVAPE